MHPRHVFNRFFNIYTGRLGRPKDIFNPIERYFDNKKHYLIDNIDVGMEILNYKDYPIQDIKLSELKPSLRLRAAYIMHSLSNPILFKNLFDTSIESLLIRRVWVESNIH